MPPARIRAIAGLVGAGLLLLANAWTGSLLGSDDAVYAEVAREGLARGALLDPTWHGRPFLEKGPVLPVLLGASMAACGESMLALRLPGVLAGLALLAGMYSLGRAIGLSRAAAAAGAAFVLATNAFYFNARRPLTDVPAAALATWGLALLAGRAGLPGAAFAGALLGLSALTKLTMPIPFLLAAAALRRWRDLAIAAGVAVAVALPWHAWMWARHGDAFVETYFLYHVVHRAASAVVGEGGGGPYVGWLIERDAVATVLFSIALVAAMLRRPRGLAPALLLASLLPLVVSATALPHYLVGLLPAAGLVAATGAEAALSRRRFAAPVLAIVLGLSFVVANARDLITPDYDPGAMAACAAARDEGREVAAAFDLHDPAVDFYCGREVPILTDDPGFAAAVAGIPMLQGHVRPASASDLTEVAASRGLVVTRPDRMDALRALAADAGLRVDSRRYGARELVSVGR